MRRLRPGTDRGPLLRLLAGAGIGTTLEWYDFGLFGTLSALVFPQVFFPHLSPYAGPLASFATFGVGILFRPLGALYFNIVGDRYGRKRVLIASLALMGLASLGIGLLPGYAVLGTAAPVLLVLLRCAQGFSLGGEPGTATVMAMEYAAPRFRATTVAGVNVGVPLGQVLIVLVVAVVNRWTGAATFTAWGWRIPVLFGSFLAVLGFLLRRRIEETPVFRRAVATAPETWAARSPLRVALRRYPQRMLLLLGTAVPPVALAYLVNVYALSYFTRTLHLPSDVGLTALLVVNVAAMLLLPAGAWLADRYGRKPVLYLTGTVSLLGVLVYFPLADTRSWWLIVLATLLTIGVQQAAGAARATLWAESFPTEVRATAYGAVTAVGNLVGGSATPFLAQALVHRTGTSWSIAALLAGGYLIALGVLPFIRETVHADIENPEWGGSR
jgi:MHS family shikimate/dehydroshikimate transporter-like MFS transporter